MLWGEEKRLCIFYALTPLHAGAGQALKAVDLPIQRERHTNWPTVQASGIKGAFRDWCEKAWKNSGLGDGLADEIFGKAGEAGSSWAGAITITDARLLLFPVRSNVSPFVHVTAPAVLRRLKEDLAVMGFNAKWKIPSVKPEKFIPLRGSFSSEDSVILEDIIVKKDGTEANDLAQWFKQSVPEAEKVIILSDDVFSYLVRTATEVQAHISIDGATGTTKDGSLRYQEYLPADSVLYLLVFFSSVRKDGGKSAKDVAKLVCEEGVKSHVQIGGDFTLGKGICKVTWISNFDGES